MFFMQTFCVYFKTIVLKNYAKCDFECVYV